MTLTMRRINLTHLMSSHHPPDRLQSQAIDLLRFPLAVGVVFGHVMPQVVAPGEADFPLLSGQGLYNIFALGCSHVAVRMTVPMFFMIAGFLFFANMRRFDTRKFKAKLASRVCTLLLPFIAWNLLSYLICNAPDCIHLIKGGDVAGAFRLFFNPDFLDIFWGCDRSGPWSNSFGQTFYTLSPFDTPLWFLRDMMVMTLLAPLVYIYVKHTRIVGLALLFGCYLTRIWNPWCFLSPDSVFFFSLGAYFAISGKNMILTARKYKHLLFIIAIPALCAATCFDGVFTSAGYPLTCIYIVPANFLAFLAAAHLIERRGVKANPFLTSSCFFLYAFQFAFIIPDRHRPILYISDMLQEILPMEYPPAELAHYFLTPLLTIASALLLYALLRHYLPRVAALLGGTR